MYTFTGEDTVKLKGLGYHIDGIEEQLFDSFMRKVFPNFEIIRLLEKVEMYFTPTTQAPVYRKIKVDVASQSLEIDYRNEYKNEDDALLFVRKFSNRNKSIEVEHCFCVLPIPYRRQGLIKPVFQESLRQYQNMDAKKINVYAGLSGGGYTWAKHGFVAIDKNEVGVILQKAFSILNQSDYQLVEKIYAVYYGKNPDGKAFPIELWADMAGMKPILMGSEWQGELDLKNKSQFNKFVEYVYR